MSFHQIPRVGANIGRGTDTRTLRAAPSTAAAMEETPRRRLAWQHAVLSDGDVAASGFLSELQHRNASLPQAARVCPRLPLSNPRGRFVLNTNTHEAKRCWVREMKVFCR